jgi:hypothetical protein
MPSMWCASSGAGFFHRGLASLLRREPGRETMHRSRVLAAFVFLVLSVSLLFGQKVRFDYDHSADFTKYKTFMWIKEPETPRDPLMKKRIIDGVNMQLMAKGLRMVNSDADLALAVHVATQEKQTLNTFYNGMGGWGWGMGGVATTTVDTYTEGTLIADLFDAATKKIVWRGVATKEMSSKPEKAAEQTEKAIDKLFKHYPPTKA